VCTIVDVFTQTGFFYIIWFYGGIATTIAIAIFAATLH